MKSFEFHSPTRILFGQDAELQTGKALASLGVRRVLIVYGGGSAERSGLLARVEATLQAEGIHFERFGGAQPNPRLAHAEQGVAKALEMGAEGILAVGGGSAIDTAKGIAHGAANPGTSLWDIWIGAVPLTRTLPLGVVLTIPAAGSETSNSAVLTNADKGLKRGLSTQFNRPAFAIMNPALAMSLPKYQVACGIADILMHTLDRYFTHTKGNELTDGFAEALLRNVIENGGKIMDNPQDEQAMSELMWSGSISHNGLTGLGAEMDFAPHKLGHELSAMFDVAHGASLTAVWDAWARHVYGQEPERFARFAEKIFGIHEKDPEKAALLGIQAMVDFFARIGMPVNLPQLQVGEITQEMMETMANLCTDFDNQPVAKFKVIHRADALAIYQAANRPGAPS